MRIAIIDLGTNTFNLLIADVSDNKTYKIIFKDKAGVKLGKGGINNKTITPESFRRGMEGIALHMNTIKKYHADKIIATATSAIRNAKNGKEFVDAVKEKFGIKIRIISGNEEADLIFRGVKQAVSFNNENAIILDIGGGSNEFIIANSSGVLWKKSFPLGIARLLDMFNPSDPITQDEIKKVENYINSKLNPLYQAYENFKPTKLIGCSGTFDSFQSMLAEKGINNSKDLNQKKSCKIALKDYELLHQELLESTLEERVNMKGLEPVRVEMIVLASIFVNFIIRKLNIQDITQSAFAIKEGLVDKLINS